MALSNIRVADSVNRRSFIGGSDARIIMRQDEKALIRLWQEKSNPIVEEGNPRECERPNVTMGVPPFTRSCVYETERRRRRRFRQ